MVRAVLRNVFLKSLREQRAALAWWAVGVIALCLMTVAFYPSMRDSRGMAEYFEEAPEWIKTVMGDPSEFTTPTGYLNGELFFMMVPILFLIFAISRGSGAIAGEEQAGTLDLLLSNPLSRRRVLLEKAASMLAALLGLGLALWVGLALGAAAVGMDISLLRLADACFSGVLLGAVFGSLALALGCASGRRGLTIGVTAALGVGTFFLKSLAPLIESLEVWGKLSPFYYYDAAQPLKNGLSWAHAAVLAGAAAFFVALSVFLFDRRDIAV